MSTNLFVTLNKMHAAITPTTISVGYIDSHTLKHNSEKLNLVSKTPGKIILTFIISRSMNPTKRLITWASKKS